MALAAVVVVGGTVLGGAVLISRLASGADLNPLVGGEISHPDGLSLHADPASLVGSFRVSLKAAAREAFLSGLAGSEWSAARAALPTYLSPAGPLFSLETAGETPDQITLSLTIPRMVSLSNHTEAQPPETLDLYAWDGTKWTFLPSHAEDGRAVARLRALPRAVGLMQAGPQIPMTLAVQEIGQTLSPEVTGALNVLSPAGVRLGPDGSLGGGLAGGYVSGQGYAVMPVIRNYDESGADLLALLSVLSSAEARQAHVDDVTGFVLSQNFDGVVIDYRGVDFNTGTAFANMIGQLAGALHAVGKSLFVVVEPAAPAGGAFATGGYDWQALGASADALEIPLGLDPQALGNGQAEALLAWAAGEVSRYKIHLMVSGRSVDGAGGAFATAGFATAFELLGRAALEGDQAEAGPGSSVSVTLDGKATALDFDADAQALRLAYTDDAGAPRTLWVGTPGMLSARLALAHEYRLGGVNVWDLMHPGAAADLPETLVNYKTNQIAPAEEALSLVWTLTDPSGASTQAAGAPGQPYTFVVEQPGAYQIAAHVAGAAAADLGSVQVEVREIAAASIATPTPVVGAGNPSSGGSAPTAAPTAAPPPVINPGATGPFELGGQVVHGGIVYANDMKRAGMNWVKLQGYYGNDLAAAISNAHSLGFKILLSITDNAHASAPVTDPAYQQAFAQYLAALAAQGADAIEVWNEPNIDREWPTGQVSGANYVALLQTVYPVIKAANPGTLVISAAPAPTGYFGSAGCAAQGCNDDVFLQAVTAAGGANYLNCVGIHFNSGTTSPSATSGSALSGYHYSYYFWPMVNTYRAAFNNARQLCFTELGYLTGEGYSPDLASVAPTFSWAAGNTVGQQAAWLAESAVLSRDSGVVRMMIVFNVDFTGWGADPQGGYAIIRPGGGCPACDSLDAVMP